MRVMARFELCVVLVMALMIAGCSRSGRVAAFAINFRDRVAADGAIQATLRGTHSLQPYGNEGGTTRRPAETPQLAKPTQDPSAPAPPPTIYYYAPTSAPTPVPTSNP